MREALKTTPPLVLSAPTMSGCRGRARQPLHVHPGLVPGRHHQAGHGHAATWAIAGATYIVQEYCNALFDALFHILPLAPTWTASTQHRPRLASGRPWDVEAQELLDAVCRA